MARTTLTALRRDTGIEFSWIFINVEVTDPAERNTVLSTSPSPGSIITEETNIIIRITRLVEGG
jgi:beta-lactam-binding protein with PASTA domain